MNTEQIVGLVATLLVMGVGLLGSVLPVLPGTTLVFLAAVAHRLYFGATGPGNWTLGILAALTALSLVLDQLASVYGAKRLGATRRGMIGAVLGGLVGLLFSLPGILVGPFVGAFLLELSGGREWREAGKAGLGAALGLLGGAVAKFACCVTMIILFAWNVIARSGQLASP